MSQPYDKDDKRLAVSEDRALSASATRSLVGRGMALFDDVNAMRVSCDTMHIMLARDVRMEFVRVPAGDFLMGSEETGSRPMYDDETPQRKVWLDEYWIGKYPVTVAQFREFVYATGYQTTAERIGEAYVYARPDWKTVRGANWQHPRGPEDDVKRKADHPVTQIYWGDALVFCAWVNHVSSANVELPTEAQWEKAARGVDGRIYPWGNEEPDARRCNYNLIENDTTTVGKYSPDGNSPYGCMDMAGNVWEWCADWYAADYYAKAPAFNPRGPASGVLHALRGGAWMSTQVHTAARFRYAPGPVNFFGVRCVRGG